MLLHLVRSACLTIYLIAYLMANAHAHEAAPDVGGFPLLQEAQEELRAAPPPASMVTQGGLQRSHDPPPPPVIASLSGPRDWGNPATSATVVQGGLLSLYAPPPPPVIRGASLQSAVLPLGATVGYGTTPDDVVPGHCLRISIDVPRAGSLNVEARSVGGAPLAAMHLGEQVLVRCPSDAVPGEHPQMAASESAPARSGFVSLDACARRAGQWQLYASGTIGDFSMFNVTARLGDPCVAGTSHRGGWLDLPPVLPPTPGWIEVACWLVGAVLTLGVLAALALVLSMRRRKGGGLER